jgi:competence protein ComEC
VRLSWWVASLAAGIAIALGGEVTPRSATISAPASIITAFCLARRRHMLHAEAVAAFAVGLYMGARSLRPPPFDPPLAALLDADSKVTVQGWVLDGPDPVPPRAGCRLRVAMERIDQRPARATVALAIAEGVPDLLPGDAVRFTAGLRSVRGLANPGLPDAAAQVRANGIDLFAGVGAASSVKRLSGREVEFPSRLIMPVLRAAARVRRALGRAMDGSISGTAGTFMHTAVLGERRNTDPRVEEGFRAAGATHILSVSGLHLAAIAMVFFTGLGGLVQAVPRLPLWVEPRAAAAWLAIPAIAFYTLVTGGAIATVRSALMMAVGLLGVALGRRSTPLVAIAAAVLAMLGWSPLVMVDISFQLSVVSVLALAILVPRLMTARDAGGGSSGSSGMEPTVTKAGPLARASWLGRPLGWLSGLAIASVTAGLATAPIVAHHFGEITPAALIGNLILVPLVELLVVPLGLLGATLGAACGRTWGLPLLTAAGWAARAALGVADLFRAHAPVWLTRSPNLLETASLSLGFSFGLAWVGSRRRRSPFSSTPSAFLAPRTSWPLLLGTVLLLGTGTISLGARELLRRCSRSLIVTFLDVGQGDAAVVQLPGGRTVLVDGGGTYDGSFDPGARVVEPFLRARGITRLDAVALSHPHPDHLGGLHRIIARFPIDRLWTSGDDGHNPDYRLLLAEARERGVPTPVPSVWHSDLATIEALGPFVTEECNVGDKLGDKVADKLCTEHIGPPDGTSVNDASLVLRVEYAARGILFTGDIEANGEGELVGRRALGQPIASDVLKVPHHGSRTSSGADLLDAVHPKLAVISLGWHNRFHFPRPEVIARYRARDIRILRTDQDGAVTFTIGPDGATFATCERGCR